MSALNVTLLRFTTGVEILTGVISHRASGVSANLEPSKQEKKQGFDWIFLGKPKAYLQRHHPSRDSFPHCSSVRHTAPCQLWWLHRAFHAVLITVPCAREEAANSPWRHLLFWGQQQKRELTLHQLVFCCLKTPAWDALIIFPVGEKPKKSAITQECYFGFCMFSLLVIVRIKNSFEIPSLSSSACSQDLHCTRLLQFVFPLLCSLPIY